MGPITSPVKVSVREDQVLPLQFDTDTLLTCNIVDPLQQSQVLISKEQYGDQPPPNFFGFDL